MKQIKYEDIFTPELAQGAILHEAYIGFKEDYLTLHCLLKIHNPKRFLEIGTNMGVGTKIIKNALGEDSQVFSLDLPTDLAHLSAQHPINEGKGDTVGTRCDLDFTQLRGNSLTFNYSDIYPIDGWYIDGEHDYDHSHHESSEAFKSGAKIIIWHDSDMEAVYDGIMAAFKESSGYEIFRVVGTRIAFALKK